eukprot:8865313-Pyramimonas_sp.AAC.3
MENRFENNLSCAWMGVALPQRPDDMATQTPVVKLKEPTPDDPAAAPAAPVGKDPPKGKGKAPPPAKGAKGDTGAAAQAPTPMGNRDLQPGSALSAGQEYNEWLLYTMLNIRKHFKKVRAASHCPPT